MTRRDTIRAALAAASSQPCVLLEQLSAADKHAGHSTAPPEPDRWRNYKPQFFTLTEFEMLQHYAEILIPADDQPGARDAHVAEYIDFVVHAAAAHAPEMQTGWKQAVAWLASRNFDKSTPAERLALVENMSAPDHDKTASRDGYPTYLLIKNMTVFAFYTSRVGLIDNLNYKGLAYLTEFPACTHPEHQG
ncbi:MAG: gluconate 2-dehydrogenase subunit 3 family protein [Bryobacteraceae bacterium]